MKNEEFMKKFQQDQSFKEKFKNAKSKEEMISIAKKEGYDLTSLNGKEEASLTEDMLESVAGGKGNVYETEIIDSHGKADSLQELLSLDDK